MILPISPILFFAFHTWYSTYDHKEVDKEVVQFLNKEIKPFQLGKSGWLKRARKGLFISLDKAAKKLNISRAAYSKYERSEERGAITLATLAKAAEALDCELIYAIRPKKKEQFSKVIWNEL